jgi:hypothetical protein
LSKSPVLAHGVAPGDHFAHGLALALRERWPSMVKDFRHPLPPEPSGAGPGLDLERPGPADREPDDAGGLVRARQQARSGDARARQPLPARAPQAGRGRALPEPRIAALATGVGGLDWKVVKPLIWQHLGTLAIPVYVYATYVPGVAANEPAGKAGKA